MHRVMCTTGHVLHVWVGHKRVRHGTPIMLSMIVRMGLVQGWSVMLERRIMFEVVGHHEVAGNWRALPAQIVDGRAAIHLKGIFLLVLNVRGCSEVKHF